jgi:hypothetical protein
VNKKKKLTKKHKQAAEQGRVGGLGRSEQAGDAGQGRAGQSGGRNFNRGDGLAFDMAGHYV